MEFILDFLCCRLILLELIKLQKWLYSYFVLIIVKKWIQKNFNMIYISMFSSEFYIYPKFDFNYWEFPFIMSAGSVGCGCN